MPYDVIDFKPLKIEDSPIDLSFARGEEGLRRLAYLLEQEQLWQDELLHWDYSDVLYRRSRCCKPEDAEAPWCGTAGCAMGLASIMWPEYRGSHDPTTAFGMTSAQCERVFYGRSPNYPKDEDGDAIMEMVTPAMVAAEIRLYLSGEF